MKKIRYIFLLLGFILSNYAFCQLYEAGFHFGYNISNITVKENSLTNQIFVRNGRSFSGANFGIQLKKSPPKEQNVNFFKIIPSVQLEATICRCGGSIQVTNSTTFLDSSARLDTARTLNIYKYVFYQSMLSPKFVANMKNLRFLIGPTVSVRHYAGLKRSDMENVINAENQFSSVVVGYELGAGYKFGNIEVSIRYHNNITDFGLETSTVPTKINNNQLKFMMHYFFLRKHQGKYWDSIYWD